MNIRSLSEKMFNELSNGYQNFTFLNKNSKKI